MNASRPSEQSGGNVKTFRWDHRLKRQNLFMAGSLMVVTLGQQYNVGKKITVILYTYVNRQAGTPDKNINNVVVHHQTG